MAFGLTETLPRTTRRRFSLRCWTKHEHEKHEESQAELRRKLDRLLPKEKQRSHVDLHDRILVRDITSAGHWSNQRLTLP